jgi:hypothetical protein
MATSFPLPIEPKGSGQGVSFACKLLDKNPLERCVIQEVARSNSKLLDKLAWPLE